MILTKEEQGQLNHFATDQGGRALETLAEIAWNYYSRQAVITEGNLISQNQGAARFADWLKKLPKALRERDI